MPGWYIVKDDGSATGDQGLVTSQPTESFSDRGATNYYASITAALAATTTPTSADFIICSDIHDFTSGSTLTYLGTSAGNSPVLAISVDDTAMGAEKAGAKETTAGSADVVISGNINFQGITFVIGDDWAMTTGNVGSDLFKCQINLTGTSDKINMISDGVRLGLYNTNIIHDLDVSTGTFLLQNAGAIEMIGGSIVSTAGAVDALFQDGGINGGMKAHFVGVDLSDIDGTLLKGVGAGTADDLVDVLIEGCRLNAGVAKANEEFSQNQQVLRIFNSSDSSTAAEHQIFVRTAWGDIQDDTTIIRNETTAFPGGTKVSLKVSTSASCTQSNPLKFEIPSKYVALSGASTDTLKVYFASTTTLTKANFWLELYAPDGTNKQLYNSYTTRNADFFDTTPGNHDDDSGNSTWKDGASDLTGSNEYNETITTSGDVAADSVPRLFIYIAEPSITVYVDTEFDVVAS